MTNAYRLGVSRSMIQTQTIQLHQNVTKFEAEKIATNFLDKVHIPHPKDRLSQYPHEFSLGMCQRIMIAMTLSMKPNVVIADEPTASLDVTTQKDILELENAKYQNWQLKHQLKEYQRDDLIEGRRLLFGHDISRRRCLLLR